MSLGFERDVQKMMNKYLQENIAFAEKFQL